MRVKFENYAFIDAQNLHRGIKSLGWDLDWERFRVYLNSAKEKIVFIDNLEKLLGKKKSTA